MIEFALYVGLMTTHLGAENYNNNNRLIAVEVQDVVIGRMQNSLWNESYFIAYNHRFNDWSGVLLGTASGYDYDCIKNACYHHEMGSSDWVPIAAPYVHWNGIHALMQLNAINISYRFGF